MLVSPLRNHHHTTTQFHCMKSIQKSGYRPGCRASGAVEATLAQEIGVCTLPSLSMDELSVCKTWSAHSLEHSVRWPAFLGYRQPNADRVSAVKCDQQYYIWLSQDSAPRKPTVKRFWTMSVQTGCPRPSDMNSMAQTGQRGEVRRPRRGAGGSLVTVGNDIVAMTFRYTGWNPSERHWASRTERRVNELASQRPPAREEAPAMSRKPCPQWASWKRRVCRSQSGQTPADLRF